MAAADQGKHSTVFVPPPSMGYTSEILDALPDHVPTLKLDP
jgi:hypothetical protein